MQDITVQKSDAEIRQAVRNDVGEVMRIWKAENIRAHRFIPAEYWETNYGYVKNAILQAEIYVCVCNDEVAGFIGVNGDRIEGIFIDVNVQRKGMGTALLNKIKTMRSALTLNVYKKNRNAVRFYLKHHFKIIAEGIDKSTNESEYTMRWEKS